MIYEPITAVPCTMVGGEVGLIQPRGNLSNPSFCERSTEPLAPKLLQASPVLACSAIRWLSTVPTRTRVGHSTVPAGARKNVTPRHKPRPPAEISILVSCRQTCLPVTGSSANTALWPVQP